MPPAFPPSVFRAYDIRGRADTQITPQLARALGGATVQLMRQERPGEGQISINLGRDCRTTSPALFQALSDGLREAGARVLQLHEVPSPLAYYAAAVRPQAPSAIVVTASHNPGHDNGFKLVLWGEPLSEQGIQQLRRIMEAPQPPPQGAPGVAEEASVSDEYLECVRGKVRLQRPLRVVVDAGNGVVGLFAPALYRALGCEVVELFCEPDSSFPNHHPDPSKEENLRDLQEAVVREGADLGLAFDGDGDRLGIVTDAGAAVVPDALLMLLAERVLAQNPGADIVFDVKCAHRLEQHIRACGGNPVMVRTGHTFIKERLRTSHAPFAGEVSGHFFFNDDWYGFDDALYSGARVLQIAAAHPGSTQELLGAYDPGVATGELEIPLHEGDKFALVDEAVGLASELEGTLRTIDGLRIDRPDGWGVMRASNTSDKLGLRFGGDSQEAMQRVRDDFARLAARLSTPLDILP